MNDTDNIERYREPWDAWFGDRTLSRGTTYARQGRVHLADPIRRDDQLILRAVVEGNHDYETEVCLDFPERDVDGTWLCGDLDSSCSCPVGDFCKHAVALIVYAEQQMLPHSPQKRSPSRRHTHGDELPEGFPDWQINSSPEQSKDADARRWLQLTRSGDGLIGKRRLCWIVDYDQDLLQLRPAWQQVGKRGWGNPRELVNPPNLDVDDLGHLSPIDLELLDRLGLALPWQTIAAAIASGRCFLRNEDCYRVCTEAPLRSVHGSWQDDAGLLSLRCSVDEEANADIVCNAGCWIDRANARIGPLDLPAFALEGLYPAPAIDHGQALEASANLRARGLSIGDPPDLPEQGPETLHPEIAVFQVMAMQFGAWGENNKLPIDLLLPSFRYDNQRLPALPGNRLADGRLRDRPAEERLAAALFAAELHPIQESQGRLYLPNLPHRHLCWSAVHDRMFDGRSKIPLNGKVSDRSLRLLALAGWQIEGRVVDIERVPMRALQLHLREDDDGAVLSLAGDQDEGGIDLVPLLALALREGVEALPQCEHEGKSQVAWADPHDESRLLLIERALIEQLIEQLIALHAHPPADDEEWRIDLDAAAALASGDLDTRIDGERLRKLHEALSAAQKPEAKQPATGFLVSLRQYQELGLGWLERLAELGFGGVLADDMGLGKTVQCMAHIWNLRERGDLPDGCLVVAPVSTLGNWQREVETCCPQLSYRLWHGPKRGELPASAAQDLILTSYATLQRSKKIFDQRRFSLVVCDEAQQLRNPVAKTTRALKALESDRRLALTGTPLENSHEDLWSLISWIEPGWLGSLAAFRRRVEADAESGALRRRLAPILLRRSKEAVASDLPPRTEIIERVELSSDQTALYETVRAASDARIGSLLAERGLAKSRIHIFEALLRLRQVCCDPRLLPDSQQQSVTSSKSEQVLAMLAELQAEGRQALVFSSFASLLEILAKDLATADISHELLTGKTRNRQDRIDRFQAGDFCAFLISLKAGGTGLNLTAADTVIHLDPWWNPMAERQASDRAHRIGQDKPVFIYKLVAAGTIEDRILDLQRQKARMLDELFDADGQALGQLDEQTLRELLAPL